MRASIVTMMVQGERSADGSTSVTLVTPSTAAHFRALRRESSAAPDPRRRPVRVADRRSSEPYGKSHYLRLTQDFYSLSNRTRPCSSSQPVSETAQDCKSPALPKREVVAARG
jgi:hypothetical protein